MNCQRARDLIPDQAAGVLDSKIEAELLAHIDACPACAADLQSLTQTLNALDAMPTPKPSARVRASVYAAIEQEKRAVLAASPVPAARPHRTSLLFWIVQPFAACALLAVGFLLGNRQHPQAVVPNSTQPIATSSTSNTEQKIAELQGQLEAMKQVVAMSLQKDSATDRIKNVQTASYALNPNDQVIRDLISTMTLDPSANVRLNAVDALYKHANEQVVRTAVVQSLTHEACPLVQQEMINFVTSIHDKDAVPELQKLISADSTDKTVREIAKSAISQL